MAIPSALEIPVSYRVARNRVQKAQHIAPHVTLEIGFGNTWLLEVQPVVLAFGSGVHFHQTVHRDTIGQPANCWSERHAEARDGPKHVGSG